MRQLKRGAPWVLMAIVCGTSPVFAKKNKEKKEEETEEVEVEETPLDPDAPNSGVVLEENLEETGGEEESDFDDESSAPSSGSAANLSPVDVMLGVGAINRHLHYTDNASDLAINAPLAIADNNVTAAYGSLSGHWYPFKYVGLSAAYARSLPKKVEYAPNYTYSHSYQAFSGGLRGRIPVSILLFGIEANYGRQALWVRSKDGADPQVFPDINTSYVEGRVDATVTVNQISLTGYFGYRQVLGVGEIADDDWFKNAKAKALTYGLEFAYRLGPSWQLVAGMDAQSYGYNFNRVDPATALRVAGGATDRYLSFFGGLRWNLPGSDSGQASSADSESEGSGSDGGGFDSFD